MTGPRERRRRRGSHPDDLRPEYDFRELGPGVRGKYYERAIAGPIVVTLRPDDETPPRPRRAAATRPKTSPARRALPRIPPAVASKLGHYVYIYVNPLDGSIFYVGKGRGGRALAHLEDVQKREVAKTIRAIRAAGAEPRIEILAHALPSAEVALHVEAAVIDALGLPALANLVRGWRGAKFGRAPVAEVVAQYTRRRARISEPSILIRINRLYRYGTSEVELYDATRSAWVVGERRERAAFAFAVFEGVVRQVYEITGWLPGGSTFNSRAPERRRRDTSRWEFVGVLAPDEMRRRYINSYVGDLFDQGAQNPISYVNVD